MRGQVLVCSELARSSWSQGLHLQEDTLDLLSRHPRKQPSQNNHKARNVFVHQFLQPVATLKVSNFQMHIRWTQFWLQEHIMKPT